MKITKVKNGKSIKITYEEGTDKKTIMSKEMAAPEFYAAFDQMAFDIKQAMADALNVDGEVFDKINVMIIEAVSFRFDKATGAVESYEVWGDHYVDNTIWDTPIHLAFDFGAKQSPDGAALNILKEAEKYVENKRAQMSLFEDQEKPKEKQSEETALKEKLKDFRPPWEGN